MHARQAHAHILITNVCCFNQEDEQTISNIIKYFVLNAYTGWQPFVQVLHFLCRKSGPPGFLSYGRERAADIY